MIATAWESRTASVAIYARSKPWLAFGSAVAIEVTFVLTLLMWIATRPPQVQEKVVPLTIEVAMPATIEELPKPPEPVQAKALPQPPKPVTRTVTPLVPAPQVATIPTPLPVAQTPSPAQAVPTLNSPPVQAAAPAPSLQPAVDPTLAYNAKITAAAQAALEVPGTVTSLNFRGRARVGFKLRDGVVSDVVIVQSSGLGAMDRAATKAVQTANYPVPPASLQGKEVVYEIWVTHTPAN